jgi:hypothetical protein
VERVEDDYDDEPRPVRRKRRRKKHRREADGRPAWLWLIFAAGAFITLGGAVGTIAWLIHADLMMDVAEFGIVLAILTPISAVIFIASMFLSSAIAGGIDFGQPLWAILKVAGLLLVINIVQLIPFAGPWIALVIWVCALMALFGLDFFEASLLIVVNWVLNYIARWIVLAFVLSMITEGKDPGLAGNLVDDDVGMRKPRLTKKEIAEQEALEDALHMVRDAGGDVIEDESGEVQSVMLANSRVKDEDLARLKGFKRLRNLVLSNTQITDEGLAHLKEIKTLVLVGVEGTRVTDAGIRDLKQALPRVTINK